MIVSTSLALATAAHADTSADKQAPKPGFEFTAEDFGIGRKHTPNVRCNREIDKILEETRSCFNSRPAAECEALQKKNAQRQGQYIRSPRCAKK